MGYAKIIKGISFAAKNLGQVTPVQSSDLDRIEIVQGETIDNTIQFDVDYISVDGRPVKAEQKGVTWSIVSGEEYATINQTGLISINKISNNNEITIKCMSLYDSSISIEKTIIIKYNSLYTDIENTKQYIKFDGLDWFDTDFYIGQNYTIKTVFEYIRDSNNTKEQIIFGYRDFNNRDDNSYMLSIEGSNSNYTLSIKYAGIKVNSIDDLEQHKKLTAIQNKEQLICNGIVLGKIYNYPLSNNPIHLAIGKGFINNMNGIDNWSYNNSKLYGIAIYNENGTIIHNIVAKEDVTLYDEVTKKIYNHKGTGCTYGIDQ